jgi:hypothetical protein
MTATGRNNRKTGQLIKSLFLAWPISVGVGDFLIMRFGDTSSVHLGVLLCGIARSVRFI